MRVARGHCIVAQRRPEGCARTLTFPPSRLTPQSAQQITASIVYCARHVGMTGQVVSYS